MGPQHFNQHSNQLTRQYSTDWQLGTWTIYSELHRVECEGESFRVMPKVLATLLCLIEHQGNVVTREMLFKTVWAGTIVSDDTLNRAISDLRQIFKDTPQQPRVIETIHRRGYRLLLPAHPVAEPPQVKGRDERPAAKSVKKKPKWHGTRYLGIASLSLLLGLFGFSLTQIRGESVASAYRAVPLTSSPGFEFDVALSFDGEKVAYVASSEHNKQMDLFVKQIGVETPQQITDNERIEISPGWSPDGRALAFLAGKAPFGPCGLYVMKLPGGDERKMADCQTLLVTGVSWSPDGTSIVYSDRISRDEPFRIYELNVETRKVTQLTNPSVGLFGDFSATYSPDGTSVAFIRGTVASTTALILAPALGDIHTISINTGQENRVTFDNQEISHLDWTPDGESLIFASHRERGTPGLWKISSQGGTPQWLLGNNAFVRMPMLARHKNRLVFEQWDNDVSIWQIAIDSLKLEKTPRSSQYAKPLVRSTHFDATPQFSPDGAHLAFTSRRSGASEIWISDADGQHPIQLTSFGGPFTSSPRWSPDGTQLTFETRTGGQTDIYVMDIKGGAPRRVTQHALQDMVPSWSPDGTWIYFSSNRTGSWQIWRVSSQGGSETPVTTAGGFRALASPAKGHNMLYYTRLGKPGLYRTSLDGGTEELVLSDLNQNDWGNWTPAKTGIYFLNRQLSTVSFYDYKTEQITAIGPLRFLPIGMIGFTLSPDLKTLAFVKQQHKNADLWMVDKFE